MHNSLHLQEKESYTQKLSNGTLWGQMVNGLIQLAMAEKTYASLMFLGLKWFGRRDVSRRPTFIFTMSFRDLMQRRYSVKSDSCVVIYHICKPIYCIYIFSFRHLDLLMQSCYKNSRKWKKRRVGTNQGLQKQA